MWRGVGVRGRGGGVESNREKERDILFSACL